MPALNNATTADGYTAGATLVCPGSRRLTIHARNAAVYYQLGHGMPAIQWDPDGAVFLPPGTLSGERTFDAVRLRSAAAGKPAQVTVDAG